GSLERPYVHLGDYMQRWWLIAPPLRSGEPGYENRKWTNRLRWLLPFYARIHVIRRADAGRDLHNHPFWFRSIILSGCYTEELLDGSAIAYQEGDVNIKGRDDYHRITDVWSGGAITLVVHGHRSARSWGFLTDTGHVRHTDYRGE